MYMVAMVLPSMAQPLALSPPFRMESFLSGIISAGSMRMNTPRPVHFLQAPKGLLKENIRGVSSSMDTPQSTLTPCSGQA